MTENPFDRNGPSEDQDEPKLEVVAPSALEALQRAEVDIAISTAKRYPRDIARAIKTCSELALRNPAIAEKMNYAVPRGAKKIVGPSVHFARILAHAWGNLRMGSRVIGCDRENAHLQGVCHDLETNVAETVEMDWPVQAPHVDTPERWKDQMTLAKRAGAAVALRNAVFETLPFVLFADIPEKAKLVATGEGKTFEERRNAAVAEFKRLGLSQPQLYQLLDRGGLESITTDDLIYLHGLLTSINDRTITVDEIVSKLEQAPVKPNVPSPPAASQTQDKPVPAAKLKKRETKPKEPATPAPASTAPASQPMGPPAPPPAPAPPVPAAPAVEQPAKPPSLADQVREQLLKSGFNEPEFVRVLADFELNRAGATKLDDVLGQDLVMVLSDWESVVDQMNARREVEQELPM